MRDNRRRKLFGFSLLAMGAFAVLGPHITPSVAFGAPLRIDLIVLVALGGLIFLLPAGRTRGGMSWAVSGGLFGLAFVAPWAAFPWLVVPALAIVWAGRDRSRRRGWVGSGVAVALLAAIGNSAVVAAASARGLRVSAEDFASRDFRVNSLLADVPLHDVWAVDLEGHPSPTLDDLGNAFRSSSLIQVTPVVTGLGLLREVVCSSLGWEDPRWSDPSISFVHRLTEADLHRSTSTPGNTTGIWRVLYAFPREGVVETINGTAHVAVAATIGEGPDGHTLFLSFHVREVNWTTPWYMRMIDPSRRYFLYPPLLRQFAHTWERGDWEPSEELRIGEGQ